ncbi:MAG: hypothetical protein GY839_02780 [candidate division Zixibacteria bacterium]|nr:hypothetical protein [candidate division Zixibacteria bacterium]
MMNKLMMTAVCVIIMLNAANAGNNRCSFGGFEELGINQFAIDISINNHDTLAGFQIPFSFEDEEIDMTCDSISFIESRCGNFDMLDGQINNENKSILIMGIYQVNPAVEQDPLSPGHGLVAKAYFTVNNPDEIHGHLKKQVRFFKKKFKASGNNAELGFAFWTPDGEPVDGIYENNVIDIDEE